MRHLFTVLTVLLGAILGAEVKEVLLYRLPPPEYGQAPKAIDALDEVNAVRKAKGLKPFIRDQGLTEGAKAVASYRADHLCRLHTQNDFAFLPEGVEAKFAGCGAETDRWGWVACCTYDRKCQHAGAAWARGRDGRRYMSIFVR